MSRENVEVVRQIWDAAGRRDTQAVLSLYDTDVDLDVSGFPVVATDADHYRGHEGLRRLFAEWGEIWEGADSELLELIDAGERVVSVYSYRGRGRASRLPVEEVFASVWTIRDQKVMRVEWFISRDEALAATGLAEQAASVSVRGPTEEESLARVINCPCGSVVRGDTDEELLEAAHQHIEESHPDREDTPSDEELLASAQEE